MLYLEHCPPPPLAAFVDRFWYARSNLDLLTPYRERVLPSGKAQLVINLHEEHLTGCGPGPTHAETHELPGALLVGPRIRYDVVDSRDFRELMGIVFRPHGFSAFGLPAHEVQDIQVGVLDVWGRCAENLCAKLREAHDLPSRWHQLEQFLRSRLRATIHPAVDFALASLQVAPDVRRVDRLAHACGLSRRRFAQVFREQVGLTPKSFLRIQRFQQALRSARNGQDFCWADVAQDCGYSDQAHLVKEFQGFAEVTPEVYRAHRTQWTNHVRIAPAST